MEELVGFFGNVKFACGLVDCETDDVDKSGILDGNRGSVERCSSGTAHAISKAFDGGNGVSESGFVKNAAVIFGEVEDRLGGCRGGVERKGRHALITSGKCCGGRYDGEVGLLEVGEQDSFEEKVALAGVLGRSVEDLCFGIERKADGLAVSGGGESKQRGEAGFQGFVDLAVAVVVDTVADLDADIVGSIAAQRPLAVDAAVSAFVAGVLAFVVVGCDLSAVWILGKVAGTG